jgi:hypothetical protein
MADIFISYAREDRARVKMLARVLRANGLSVWWDCNIPAGEQFDQVIGEQLTCARYVIVLWSTNSITAHWVREEATIACNNKKLVPVLIEQITPPLGFALLQAFDLANWEGQEDYPELLRLIKYLHGRHPHSPPVIIKRYLKVLYQIASAFLVLAMTCILIPLTTETLAEAVVWWWTSARTNSPVSEMEVNFATYILSLLFFFLLVSLFLITPLPGFTLRAKTAGITSMFSIISVYNVFISKSSLILDFNGMHPPYTIIYVAMYSFLPILAMHIIETSSGSPKKE